MGEIGEVLSNEEIREKFKDLDDELIDLECQELQAEKNKFVVDSPEKADWAIAKVHQANEEIERAQRYYEAKVAFLKKLVDTKIAKHKNTIDFMSTMLKPYIELQIEGKKTKSIKLSNGSAGFRTVQAKFDVDKDKLLEWAKKSAPDKIKVTESVDWSGIKNEISVTKDGRAVTPDGELVDGVTVINGETQAFYVK